MLKWFSVVMNANLCPTSLLKQNESAIFERYSKNIEAFGSPRSSLGCIPTDYFRKRQQQPHKNVNNNMTTPNNLLHVFD